MLLQLWGGETEGLAYQYASSTQPHSIVGCRMVSLRIQKGRVELPDTEPGLQSSLTA